MADRNQLKKAVDSHISDDDPFAELTRIMGFDPREPVAPRQPAAVEKLAALQAEEIDLSLDLEKELMGEFASLDEDVQATAEVAPEQAIAPQPAPEAAAEDTLTEDFDFVFDADLVAEEQDPAIAAAADKALADELSAAFADDTVDESADAEIVATGFAGENPADGTVEAVDNTAAASEVVTQEAPAEEGEVVAQEALAEEFETAFADEMVAEEPVAVIEAVEDEAPLGELEVAVAEDTVQALEAIEAPVLADQLDDTFAAHFDDHLAAEAVAEPVAAAPEQIAEPEFAAKLEAYDEDAGPFAQSQESEDDGDVPLIPLGAARDFAGVDDNFASADMDFDAELDKELAQTLDGSSAQPAEPEDDYDLEAELSALLGKSTSVATPVAAPLIVQPSETAFAAEEAAEEPLVSLDDDWAVDNDDPLPMVAETHESEAAPEQQYDEAALEQQDFEPEAPVLHTGPRADVPAMMGDDAGQGGCSPSEDDAPAYALSEEEPHLDAAPDEDEIDPLSEFVVEQELEAELAALDGDLDLAVEDLALDDEPPAYAAGDELHSPEAQDHAVEPVIAAPAENEIASAETAQPVAAKAPFVPASTPKAPEPLAAEEEDDPFAMLAAMVRETQPVAPPVSFAPASMNYQDLSRSNAPTASESPAVSTTEYQYQNNSYTGSYTGAGRAPVTAPDIDTVDVPETAVALADDLDIPDISFEDDQPLAADFDDFEAELASAFHQSPVAPAQPASEPVREAARDTHQNEYAHNQQPVTQPSYYGAATAAAYVPAPPAAADEYADDYGDFDNTALPASQAAGQYRAAADDDDLAYDPELNEDMSIASYQDVAEARSSGNRRGLMIAAIVGGVVLIGGIGAYALSGGNGSGTPALVRADTDPVKIRPENPGGTSVPNQDNKVFQTMNGKDTTGAPTQEKLISGTEEPVDMAARAEPRVVTPQPANEDGEDLAEDAPLMADDEIAAVANDAVAAEIASAPKGEDRVAPSAEEPAANSETLAVAPRRVRTMVVRSDGTLVPSEEPAPQPQQAEETTASALEPADPSRSLSDPIAPESTGSLTPSAAAPAKPASPAPVETAAAPAAPTPAAATQSGMPASGPVAPSRPADQPVDVVGEVKPQQVAAASGAVAAGAWSVQIASQPSEAAAQSSYQDLARRYGSVIGDKGVNIVKAEIAGKGTFWRVRVPAGSRNDAISLCESYKAAGGNCFVSK